MTGFAFEYQGDKWALVDVTPPTGEIDDRTKRTIHNEFRSVAEVLDYTGNIVGLHYLNDQKEEQGIAPEI